MSFFQHSVVEKYLKTLDHSKVTAAYEKLKAYFHNPEIQNNIRNIKEEEFQEGFLRELFVNVIGYTLNPQPNYNLLTEQKNEKDSKKADGAIVLNNGQLPIVVGVIELKSTATTDLAKVETQAFGYKNNHPKCIYVVTSNFEKLRFYIDNAVDYLEFNLFTITPKEFELLYLCLAYENIEKNIPKKIKDESLCEQDIITAKLYKDYSLFKRELHQNLVSLNPQFDSLMLFRKSQKLLDRFLFLFFAEDRQLLPPNSVRLILDDWRDLQERDENVPLYNRLKKYFEYLNTGFKGKRYDVYPYNGGLFKADELLDGLKIDNELLYKHTFNLSAYDFASEVDVNILGHIFENSLNELEELKAQLEGQEVDKGKTKRKKDGIFYTPKYITKYIVDNTVGRLCTEKKAELNINEEDYNTDKRIQKKTRQELVDKLSAYRNWLLKITICDPACGSGAFLNQALDFLINEHRYIDELQAKLFGDAMVLSDVEKSILENNIFGVDINEESVEIAKLSLWLHTAKPNRKLNDLNNNIKCGNSLIDDPNVAGEKAFNWQKEFPGIFVKKEKKARHITWVTHNSRTSQRMIDNRVQKGEAFWMDEETEIFITASIRDIVKEDGYNVLEYNICGDHIHLLLVCSDEELPNIIRKLKGKSAQKLKEKLQIPKEEVFHLWAQKYSETYIDSEEKFQNTIAYIRNNCAKHFNNRQDINKGLQPFVEDNSIHSTNKGLQPLAEGIIRPDINTGQLPGVENKGLQPLAEKPHAENCMKRLQPIIDEMRCTHQHAFRTEYAGGFDVVIGNPPYVRQELLEKGDKEYYIESFSVGNGTADLYVYFYERGINILKNKGLLGFITPNKFYKTQYGIDLRKFLIEYKIKELVDFFELRVFEDASTDSQIIVLSKENNINKFNYTPIKSILSFIDKNFKTIEINQKDLNTEIWVFNSNEELNILNKMKYDSITLQKYTKNGIEYGIKTGLNEAFIIDKITKNKIINEDPRSAELIKPYVTATDIEKWHLKNPSEQSFINTYYDLDISQYKGIFNWLKNFDDKLKNRQDKGIHHYNLRACKYYDKFDNPKIIYIHTAVSHKFYYDIEGFYVNNSCYLISNSDLFLAAWLNSSIFSFYKKLNFVAYGDSAESGRAKLDYNKMVNVPIPNIREEMKTPFIEKANLMLSRNKEVYEIKTNFLKLLTSKYPELKLINKLESWSALDFNEFLKEIQNNKKKLQHNKGQLPIATLSEQAEWMEYFEKEKAKATALQNEINKTDKEIDAMVYELYGLTEEEIKIVEGLK